MANDILNRLNTAGLAKDFFDFLGTQALGGVNPRLASQYRSGVEVSPMDEILSVNGWDLNEVFKKNLPEPPPVPPPGTGEEAENGNEDEVSPEPPPVFPPGTGEEAENGNGDEVSSEPPAPILELVTADLSRQLKDPAGTRQADRKLLYYSINPGGTISSLTYDPITGAGARFYDLDNDGIADISVLSRGDDKNAGKDDLVNGVIDDPSFAGIVDLTNLQFSKGGSGTLTISDPSNAAPASVNLRATLASRPGSSNLIGYVVLNASEIADSAALLADLTWLRGRSRSLFSSLESTDITLPAGSSFDRDFQLINGQSIRFFEVQDASLDQLTSLADSRFSLFTAGDFTNGQVAFSSNSGVRFSLNLLPNDPDLNALISQAQGQAPILDLTAFTTAQSLSGTLDLAREADLNSIAGFYRTLDATGTVLAADTITRLRPGDSGYTAAALRTDNLIGQLGNFTVADNQPATRSFSGITGGTFLAPFAQVNGDTLFAFAGANSDRLSHFRSLGNNLFGLEDTVGGGDRDFDDLVVGFKFSRVTQ